MSIPKKEMLEGQHGPGHVNFTTDGDTAFVWVHPAWCAAVTIHRGDMSVMEFRVIVEKFAATLKNNPA